jgi:predicted RNase H-like HicB family nuclease
MRALKSIVERHSDGFLAYTLALKDVVMGQGDSYEAALADAILAAQFHIQSFGTEAFDDDSDVEAAYIAEGDIAVV